MNKHVLEGCIPIPISNYLKSLGLFRIISQIDPYARAYWEHEKFVLYTMMNKDDLLNYILKEYKPTPIIAPWSYNKYKKIRTSTLETMIKSERFDLYKETMDKIEDVIDDFCTFYMIKRKEFRDFYNKYKEDKTNIKTKSTLLRLCRNILPDETIPLLDAVFILNNNDGKTFAPLFGTGLNDGNFDLAENFIKRLDQVLSMDVSKQKTSKAWLESSLFGTIVDLQPVNSPGHNPDGCGGPNAGNGFEGKPLSNPWDYILMLEGGILFAGNLARRQSNESGKTVFPFTTNVSNVGYATASNKDGVEGKGTECEIWLPLWNNAAKYEEIKHVFNEGKIQLGKKQAKTGIDSARAIIGLGVERGISKFQRFCILKRKGDAHLFINTGQIQVTPEPSVNLLVEIDNWYNKIAKKSKTPIPESLERLKRNFDDSVMKFCTYRKKQNLLQVLIMVGKLERYISNRNIFTPLSKLSDKWLTECYDESAEFRLAASIGSINDNGSIRENLENITRNKINKDWEFKKDSTSYVWNENDSTLRNLRHVLYRRGLDGKIRSYDTIPIRGSIPARKNDIVKFLNGELDTKKIGELVLPFSMMNITNGTEYPWKNQRDVMDFVPLPEVYSVIKLIYPPGEKENIPYDLSILNILSATRINDAYERASYILHAHGMTPLRYSKKTGVVKNTSVSNVVKEHLAAALLFPISNQDRNSMLKSVTIGSTHT